MMESSYNNISQIKFDIMQIFNCLEQLNNVESPDDVENLTSNTERLLRKTERFRFKSFKTKLKQRKRARKLKPAKRSKGLKNQSDTKNVKTHTLIVSNKPLQRSCGHSKSIKECKRFLQTFELLEQLHLSRGINSSDTYKFSLKLRQLRSIWNSLLQDKVNELTPQEIAIQQEWNEVLFGPIEKTYFQLEPNLPDFVRKRQIWDSYIDRKCGSSIPIGWIVPNSNCKDQWKPYLSPTNI